MPAIRKRIQVGGATVRALTDASLLRQLADDLEALQLGTPVALTSSQVATADGSDAGTTQTLANALKAAFNLLQADVAALRTLMVTQAGATIGVTKR